MHPLRSPKEVRKQNRRVLLVTIVAATCYTAWTLYSWLFPPDPSVLRIFSPVLTAVVAVLAWIAVVLTVITNRKVQDYYDSHHQ